jgi:hypothetical protein
VDWFDWRLWRLAQGFGCELWVAEGDAGGGVEDAANGPGGFIGRFFAAEGAFSFWEEDFADALLLGAIVPAAKEGEVVGEGGEIGD